MTPEELLNEVGEPVGLFDVYNGDSYIQIKPEYSDETTVKLYTFDQVAAAIAKATKPLEDQLAKANQLWQVAKGRCDGLEEKLAKAEQRVAEACALQVATETRFRELDAARVAKEIRSGEYRKFMKGE